MASRLTEPEATVQWMWDMQRQAEEEFGSEEFAKKLEEADAKAKAEAEASAPVIYSNPADERIVPKIETSLQLSRRLELPPRLQTPKGIMGDLRPAQEEGLAMMVQREECNFAKGALLAHPTGAGKTLQLISLILANPAPFDSHVRATLVICPANCIATWAKEFTERVEPGRLRVMSLHESAKAYVDFQDPNTLTYDTMQKYDVVIASYNLLTSEYSELERLESEEKWCAAERNIALLHHSYQWWRVIVDEAHRCINMDTATYKAVVRLKTTNIHFATANPLRNDTRDFAAYFKILGLEPWTNLERFDSTFRKLRQGDANSNPSSPKDEEMLTKIARLVVIVRSREECCPVPGALHRSSFLFELTEEEDKRVEDITKRIADGHGLERAQGSKRTYDLWPRMAFCHAALVDFPVQVGKSNHEMSPSERNKAWKTYFNDFRNSFKSSSRIEAILDAACAHFYQHPCHKTAIFSESVRFLDLIGEAIHRDSRTQNWKVFMISGRDGVAKRQEIVAKATACEANTICLVSQAAASDGIKELVCVDHIIIAEPSNTPARETKAIGRSYRPPKTTDVFVTDIECTCAVESSWLARLRDQHNLSTGNHCDSGLQKRDFDPHVYKGVDYVPSVMAVDRRKLDTLDIKTFLPSLKAVENADETEYDG